MGDIATQFGLTRWQVGRLLKGQGVLDRRRGSGRRKHAIVLAALRVGLLSILLTDEQTALMALRKAGG